MQDIRKSPEYQRWRREVKHRDENTCRVCTVRRNLHVHHIKPLEKYPEFAIDLDNGITLCGNCHAFLSGREENTNLQTIIEAFTDRQDAQTTEQLKRLNTKFCVYLESLLKSEDQDIVSDAVYKMFVHLQTYPDSLDQFLHLIEYILGSEKGFEDRFARHIAIEALKNHSNKRASEILGKYETSWNYQDGKRAYSQETSLTRQSFFQRLSSGGIELCLFTLETHNAKIEIKDNRFTLLDIDRSSGFPVAGSLGFSASLNTIFDEKLETETQSDLSEAYSQLNGEVLLTQADIPTLRAFLVGIKADGLVNALIVFQRKLDELYFELNEINRNFRRIVSLWRDEIELESDKWDRSKVLTRKILARELIDYSSFTYIEEAGEEAGADVRNAIDSYNREIDNFLEALSRLEERTRIENSQKPTR